MARELILLGGVLDGVDYEVFKGAGEMEQTGAQWIGEGMKAFMFESSVSSSSTSTWGRGWWRAMGRADFLFFWGSI